MHDTTGRTMTLAPGGNPAPDAVMPDECEECGSPSLSVAPEGEYVQAACSECGHRWRTGRLNA